MTSVKMRDGDKARLDRLQAAITARTGERISQQDLLGHLVDLGERQKEKLGAEAPDERALRALMALPVRARGPRTREEDIDRDLYGARA